MPALTTSHVGLSVVDLAQSVDFYRRVFGFDSVDAGSDPPGAFLLHDGSVIVTLWEQSLSGFQGSNAGLHHLALRVGSREDVEAVERKARDAGATFIYDGPVAHRHGSSSGGIFFQDPDGIRIEVNAVDGFEDAPVPVRDGPTCGLF